MYKLLIVDDEPMERKALAYIIKGSSLVVGEIEEAVNGRQAIAKTKEFLPDIIIMDIKMPGISGIEAAKSIREFSNCKIIFLTAFNYFDYAKEALKLGAEDFIIKPSSNEKVIESIQNAVEDLDKQNEFKLKQIETQKKLEKFTLFIEDKLLSLMILGAIKEERIKEYFSVFSIKFDSAVGVILDFSSQDSINRREIIEKRIVLKLKEILKQKNIQYLIYCKNCNVYLMLISNEKIDKHIKTNWYIKIVKEINNIIENELHMKLKIGIGNEFFDVMQTAESFNKANVCLKSIDTDKNIVLFEEVSIQLEEKFFGNRSKKDKEITDRGKMIINKVCEYLEENYNKDLTLEEVSNRVNLSRFYFCKLFKENKKMKFIEYLSYLRIKKAKEFLTNPVVNIKEISYKVGYSDPNYFTRVFKRVEGMTPTEYRDKNML